MTSALIPAALLCLIATPALCDPCEGALPRPGETFAGTVRYTVDGDGFCLSDSPDPATWIEVRIADFYSVELNQPGGREAKTTLSRIAMGRRVVCVAGRRSFDRVVARCTLGGRALGELMRAAGAREGGRGKP